jgi:hypothetical protein
MAGAADRQPWLNVSGLTMRVIARAVSSSLRSSALSMVSAGPGVALEHLDDVLAVLQCPGDHPAWPTGDVPGQGAAELPGG